MLHHKVSHISVKPSKKKIPTPYFSLGASCAHWVEAPGYWDNLQSQQMLSALRYVAGDNSRRESRWN